MNQIRCFRLPAVIITVFALFIILSTSVLADISSSDIPARYDEFQLYSWLISHPVYSQLPGNLEIATELQKFSSEFEDDLVNQLIINPRQREELLPGLIQYQSSAVSPLLFALRSRLMVSGRSSEAAAVNLALTQIETGVGSYLDYLLALGPAADLPLAGLESDVEIHQLISSQGPFLGGLYSAAGDAAMYLGLYRRAVYFKRRALNSFTPSGPNDYRFASDLWTDISLAH